MFMRCEVSFSSVDSGAHPSQSGELDAMISLDEIGADDRVVIKTKNSEYRFAVIDPPSHRGMLSGGAIGEEPREAFLIESRSKDEAGAAHGFPGLKTGARALFYLSSGRVFERVTTSEISALSLVKAKDRVSLIS
jgi:hypothetical protein